VGRALKKGDIVVYESTVYPGCTEEDCVPVLEEESGLQMGVDFFVGYSPERINPGDKVNTIETIVKVVGACDEATLDTVAKTYDLVVTAGTHRASSIRVDELSVIFDKVGINTFEVLEAAGTKWNFLKFQPGLVGGHCIGIDPYYLTWKANKLGYHAKVINSGRYINDSMGFYVGKQTVKRLLARNINPLDAKVLVMGLTFKEDVADIRNTKVIDVIRELQSFNVNVDIVDPQASAEEVKVEYDLDMISEAQQGGYHAIIAAVNHAEYASFKANDFRRLLKGGHGTVIDVKGVFRGKTGDLDYWSL
jgi:UDP-N-acetyl-D-galactosamine dehydrogenase